MDLNALSGHPTVYVITPCHGRSSEVVRLLRSLRNARDRVGEDAEIRCCLIDSTPQKSVDASTIERACLEHGADYLRGPESVREKRNAAAAHALARGAELLFFTDSDCELSPDAFREHLLAYSLPASPFTGRPIGGVTGVTRFVGRQSRAYRAVARTPFLDAFSFADVMPEAPFAPCTNFSVRSSVFRRVGGFAEGWRYRLGGDDTEMGRRINSSGFAIVARPQAVVYHTTETWAKWKNVTERAWRWGRMDIPVRLAEPASNLKWAGPSPLLIFLMTLPVAALGGWQPIFALIASTCVFGISLAALLRCNRVSEWPVYLSAEALEWLFELGGIVEATLKGKPWMALREIVTHPMQIGMSWPRRRRSAWVSVTLLIGWGLLLLAERNLGWGL